MANESWEEQLSPFCFVVEYMQVAPIMKEQLQATQRGQQWAYNCLVQP